MKNILEEFAKGNITPQTRSISPKSEYAKVMKELCEAEEELLKVFSEAEKKIFQKFIDLQGEIDRIESQDRFIYGYRLGALMMIEVYNYNDDDKSSYGGYIL